MDLELMLKRSRSLEERAAMLYHRFAEEDGGPQSRALWTRMAREEEEHAREVALAARDLEPTTGWRTSVDGWGEALDEIERRLGRAERLAPDATLDQRLAAALDLEASELEALRRIVLAASDRRVPAEHTDDHACRLADDATALSDDPDVRLLAAIVRARALLTSWDAMTQDRRPV